MKVCQLCKDGCPQHVDKAVTESLWMDGGYPRSITPESLPLSTGSSDAAVALWAEEDHAESMKKALLTRLNTERYSFPGWFSPPRPDMNDTETKQARRRRQMAVDFDALHVEETA